MCKLPQGRRIVALQFFSISLLLRLLKNSIVKICKIASIVCFHTTKTDQELIFQQLYYVFTFYKTQCFTLRTVLCPRIILNLRGF